MNLTLTVLLSLLSAVAYAVAAVVQEREAATPRWWLIVGLNGGGALLHVGALAYGSLAVVQPLGALTLVVALPIGAAVAGRRVRGREWRGALATVTGLVVLLAAVGSTAPARSLTDLQMLLLVLVTTAAAAALAGRSYRPVADPARYAGLRLAAAGGIAFASSSVLTQTVLVRAGTDGVAVFASPTTAAATAAVVALAAAGLLLSQAAYRYGLGGPLATLTIANPAAAATIGVLLLGVGSGIHPLGLAAAGVAAVVAGAGVVLLATPQPVAARPACRRPRTGRLRPRPRTRARHRSAPVSRRPSSRTPSIT